MLNDSTFKLIFEIVLKYCKNGYLERVQKTF